MGIGNTPSFGKNSQKIPLFLYSVPKNICYPNQLLKEVLRWPHEPSAALSSKIYLWNRLHQRCTIKWYWPNSKRRVPQWQWSLPSIWCCPSLGGSCHLPFWLCLSETTQKATFPKTPHAVPKVFVVPFNCVDVSMMIVSDELILW